MRSDENEDKISLRPLEIRSFRINFKGAVQKDSIPQNPVETKHEEVRE